MPHWIFPNGVILIFFKAIQNSHTVGPPLSVLYEHECGQSTVKVSHWSVLGSFYMYPVQA